MPLAKICPTCQGCGRTSIDMFGRVHPQPTYADNNSSAPGWTKCASCGGVGAVAFIDNGKFGNGMDVNEYLQTRLGDM